jgi:hypothetical protein
MVNYPLRKLLYRFKIYGHYLRTINMPSYRVDSNRNFTFGAILFPEGAGESRMVESDHRLCVPEEGRFWVQFGELQRIRTDIE